MTFTTARQYIHHYCKTYEFPPPRITFYEDETRAKSEQWKADLSVVDVHMGSAFGPNKRVALRQAFFNAVLFIDAADHLVWTQYMASLPPRGDAPSSLPFNTTPALQDKVSSLLQHIESSTLCSTSSATNPQPESSETSARRHKYHFRMPTKDHLAQRSNLLLLRLLRYQSNEKLSDMRAARQRLPVTQNIKEILTKLHQHQILICTAATGSGKSTQIPQMILDDAIIANKGGTCNILCTQPRRIAAITLAQRVAEERGEQLGMSIGYQVRFDKRLPEGDGAVTYLTTGILMLKLQDTMKHESEGTDTWLDTITHIVLDEVHERDKETDLLLAVLKKVIERRRMAKKRNIKIILMSATADAALFQKYFLEVSGKPVPVVDIPGRAYPVQRHFMEDTVAHLKSLTTSDADGGWVWADDNVIEFVNRELSLGAGLEQGESEASGTDALDIPYPLVALYIANALKQSKSGHVLVFLPGLQEIQSMAKTLSGEEENDGNRMLGLDLSDPSLFEIHTLHSTVPVADQQAVFRPPPKGVRRIILSTNLAETSVTIPHVTAVVDTGKIKEKRHDPDIRLSSLVSAWVGQSNVSQRAGRAGRHRPGEYFAIMSKARHDSLPINKTVEMLREDLTDIVLRLKSFVVREMDAEELLAAAIESPAPERVQAAIHQLRLLGALDESKNLTPLGKLLGQLSVGAAQGKMIMYGLLFHCAEPAVLLAAISATRDPFTGPLMARQEVNEARRRFAPAHYRSDLLATLNAYYAWDEIDQNGSNTLSAKFCEDNFLSRHALREIRSLAGNIMAHVRPLIASLPMANGRSGSQQEEYAQLWVELNENAGCTPLLACLIAMCCAPNTAIRSRSGRYRTEKNAPSCGLPASSVVRLLGPDAKAKSNSKRAGELLCYEEKTMSIAVSSDDDSRHVLRTVTQLDYLGYVLLGAVSVSRHLAKDKNDQRVLHLLCNEWVTLKGPKKWLEAVHSLRSAIDKSVSTVFGGISARHSNRQMEGPQKNANGGKDDDGGGGGGGGKLMTRKELKQKKAQEAQEAQRAQKAQKAQKVQEAREAQDFKELMDGMVAVLKEYAADRYVQDANDDQQVSEAGSDEAEVE